MDNEIIKSQRSDILKVIAIISMVIDHVGFAFFPEYIMFRIIGRLAFPIFAYQIAQGYIYTSDKKVYMIRLWIFAAISQAPFTLLFHNSSLNVLVTLGIALFVIDCYHQKRYWLMLPLMAISFFVPMDYGLFGVLSVLAFYALRDKRELCAVVLILLIVFFSTYYNSPIQYYSVIGPLLVLYLPVQLFKIRIPKYFFYWFYPVHITVIYILTLII